MEGMPASVLQPSFLYASSQLRAKQAYQATTLLICSTLAYILGFHSNGRITMSQLFQALPKSHSSVASLHALTAASLRMKISFAAHGWGTVLQVRLLSLTLPLPLSFLKQRNSLLVPSLNFFNIFLISGNSPCNCLLASWVVRSSRAT